MVHDGQWSENKERKMDGKEIGGWLQNLGELPGVLLRWPQWEALDNAWPLGGRGTRGGGGINEGNHSLRKIQSWSVQMLPGMTKTNEKRW